MIAGCPLLNYGINVGGTAEVFSSLNLGLRDFLIYNDLKILAICEESARIQVTPDGR